MKRSFKNIAVIAQKEFADNIWSPVFLVLLLTFILVFFAFGYMKGLAVMSTMRYGLPAGGSLLMCGFAGPAKMMGWFAPLMGIALGFDAVVKERKSGSLNVLLTHPVFRDNIIVGKILGSMMTLALVLVISAAVSTAGLLLVVGSTVSWIELERIAIFIGITFFYATIFLGISVILSIVVEDAADSLVYNIGIWLATSVIFGALAIAIDIIITGQIYPHELAVKLANITPLHYYGEAVLGRIDLSFGGINNDPVIEGIFDTRFTLSRWFNEFWTEVTVLIVTPITLLIISFMAFLRKDITL